MIKQKFKIYLGKGKDFVGSVIAQWKTPAKGNFVSYKEVASYSLGGMGQDMLIMLTTYLGLGIGNTLFGSVLGIRPMHIQTMNTIVIIIDIALVALRAYIIDNTNTKIGRFRPFIAIMAVPLFLISATFVFLDFGVMSYSKKIALVFCFSLAVVIVKPYFEGSFTNIGSVITPNTKERTKVITIYSIIFSIAPTIYGFLIPILSPFTGGYTDIRTYRYIIVPIALIGVGLSFFAVFGCKERFIQPKTFRPKANLWKSALEIFKNKYWWIRTLSGWLAFMELACGNIFLWSYVYGSQNMTEYALLNTIIGQSALIAMLLTPIMLAKLGNRSVLLLQNISNIFFLGIILFTFNTPAIFFIFWFLNSLVNYFSLVYRPVHEAEVKDYQHYISGKRLDGALSFAGKIGVPIAIATGYVVPAIFETVGITTNYDILFEPMVRNKVFTTLCIAAIIGATLNLLPLFFYNYSRIKHKNIVKILRYRAMFVDYVVGDLTSEDLKLAVDGIKDYERIENSSMPNLKEAKIDIKKAKLLPKKTEKDRELRSITIKQAKKNYYSCKLLKKEKKENKLFYKEIHKFENEKMQKKLVIAKEVAQMDYIEIAKYVSEKNSIVSKRELDNERKKSNKMLAKTSKLILKYYPNGVIEPGCEYKKAIEMPNGSKEENQQRNKSLKLASDKEKLFNKVMQYFLECKRIVVEAESRVHFETIESMYEQACIEVEENYCIKKEKEEKEKSLKAKALEELKQLRFEKFSIKKQKRLSSKRTRKSEKGANKNNLIGSDEKEEDKRDEK